PSSSSTPPAPRRVRLRALRSLRAAAYELSNLSRRASIALSVCVPGLADALPDTAPRHSPAKSPAVDGRVALPWPYPCVRPPFATRTARTQLFPGRKLEN